jgi:hypothetical protein
MGGRVRRPRRCAGPGGVGEVRRRRPRRLGRLRPFGIADWPLRPSACGGAEVPAVRGSAWRSAHASGRRLGVGGCVGFAAGAARHREQQHLRVGRRVSPAARLAPPVRVDHVGRAKPFPDSYAAACRALGVEAARALAIEDSPAGAQAARDAGMDVLVVPNSVTQRMAVAQSTVQFETLTAAAPWVLERV